MVEQTRQEQALAPDGVAVDWQEIVQRAVAVGVAALLEERIWQEAAEQVRSGYSDRSALRATIRSAVQDKLAELDRQAVKPS